MPEPSAATSGLISTRSTATPGLGELDGGGGAGEAAADDEDVVHGGHLGHSGHLTAIGLTGAPTAPVTGRGAAVSQKS